MMTMMGAGYFIDLEEGERFMALWIVIRGCTMILIGTALFL